MQEYSPQRRFSKESSLSNNQFFRSSFKDHSRQRETLLGICPKDDLPPCVRKRPTFAALSFCFLPQEEDQKRSELAYILGLEKRLSQQGLYLKLLNSHISKIDLTKDEPIIYVNCPRIPADLEAKTGYRRSNHKPNKKVKVFGYQAMITTNIELEIGLELAVGCITSPADKLDGSYSILEREKRIKEHRFLPYFDIGDCGFDVKKNFHHMRITLNLMRYLKTWNKSYKKKLAAPEVLTFILSLIHRKRSPP